MFSVLLSLSQPHTLEMALDLNGRRHPYLRRSVAPSCCSSTSVGRGPIVLCKELSNQKWSSVSCGSVLLEDYTNYASAS